MLQGTIIRGTTPQHEFELPYATDLIENLHVIYGQKGKVIFTKTLDDCILDEGKLTVHLSQEETLLLLAKFFFRN